MMIMERKQSIHVMINFLDLLKLIQQKEENKEKTELSAK